MLRKTKKRYELILIIIILRIILISINYLMNNVCPVLRLTIHLRVELNSNEEKKKIKHYGKTFRFTVKTIPLKRFIVYNNKNTSLATTCT